MNRNRGFTLIELLVVIAIIGILSSVVLASLNTARGKGADAAIKANLSNARAQAELYYDSQNPNSYGTNDNLTSGDGVCNASNNNSIASAVTAAGTNDSACYASASQWVAKARLSNNDVFCVDSSGYASVASTTVATVSMCN
jgi:prepilin-type N-terminal cleavage/methylation domain-containing protein